MSGKVWLVAIGLGVSLMSSGCVTSCHQAAKAAYEAGPDCAVPLCDRQHTYAVLVNGLTPTGLDGLRDQLAKHGYTKVYSTQLPYVWWMEWEMRRVHREDNTARFVLVGYDASCPSIVGMAREATRKGLNVDSVLLLDPVGTPAPSTSATRTIVVRSGTDAIIDPQVDTVTVAEAGHFTLPTHPNTVAALCSVLKDTASRVVHPPVYSLEEKNEILPVVRRPSDTIAPVSPEWQFLDNQPGIHALPLSTYPTDQTIPKVPSGGG